MAIRLQVYQSTLEITCGEPVIEGGIRANEVVFTFSPDDTTWDGMARMAVFETRVDKRAMLLADGRSCTIPWEVLAKGSAGSYLRIGLYGTEEDDDGVIVRSTIWADNPYRVLPGPDADPGKDPTPDQYQQMLALTSKVASRLDELDSVESSVKSSEQKAAASATAASSSAAMAKNSAAAAQTSATAATGAKTGAEKAQGEAEKAKTAAAISAHNAQVWAEGGTLKDADGGNDPSGARDGAKQFAEKAAAAKELAVQSATSAAGAQANASKAAQEAATRANQAQQSASAADSSRIAAETAAKNAKASETNAQASEAAAGGAAEAAQEAKTGAEKARTAIENMLVEAVTLASGQNATVSKSLVDQVVKLTFGLPAGPAGKDGAQGEPGRDGPQGPQGVGITSIDRTAGNGAPGTTDTYTITLSNGSSTTFTVYNGANGDGSGDFMANGSVAMTGELRMGGHRVTGVGAPQADDDAVRRMDLTADNVKFTDGETFQHKLDNGELTGPAGVDGKSAYQTAVEGGYTGPEKEFNSALSDVPAHIASKSNPHGVTAQQTGAIPAEQKGAPGGLAELDDSGAVPSEQMPGYDTTAALAVMGKTSISGPVMLDNIQGNTVLGGTPAYNAPVSMESVEGPLKLHISGKNLIDFSRATKTGTASGVSYSISDDGAISLSGVCDRPGSSAYIMPFGDGISKAFHLPAGTYYLSGLNTDYSESKAVYLYLNCYDVNGDSVVSPKPTTYGPAGVSFVLPDGGAWVTVNVAVKDGTDMTGVTITPQIEVGNQATDYEPPSSTTVEIPLTGTDGQTLEPLRMSYIGRYGTGGLPAPDRVVRKDGMWCVERNTAFVDFTAATWSVSTNYMMPYLNGDIIRGQESHWVLCTHFPSSGSNPSTVWTAGIWVGNGMAINKESLPNGTSTTREEMAAWCAAQNEAGTPVLAIYTRKEPVYEELHQDVQVLLNTLSVPGGVSSVWFEGDFLPSGVDIGLPRGDYPNAGVEGAYRILGRHMSDNDNPHRVTAAQVGALPADGGTITGDLGISSGGMSAEFQRVGGIIFSMTGSAGPSGGEMVSQFLMSASALTFALAKGGKTAILGITENGTTFSGPVSVDTPSADEHAVNKGYVDASIKTAIIGAIEEAY